MNDALDKVAWSSLCKEEQTELLIAFGYYLYQPPPTCSMEAKKVRLRDLLGRRGIAHFGGK